MGLINTFSPSLFVFFLFHVYVQDWPKSVLFSYSFFYMIRYIYSFLGLARTILIFIDFITCYVECSSEVVWTCHFFSLDHLIWSLLAFILRNFVVTLTKVGVSRQTPDNSVMCCLITKVGERFCKYERYV